MTNAPVPAPMVMLFPWRSRAPAPRLYVADEHLVALGDAGAADVQRRRVGGVVCDHVGDVQVAGGEQVPAGQGVGGGVVLPDADPVVGADGAAALRADAHAHSPALFGGDH